MRTRAVGAYPRPCRSRRGGATRRRSCAPPRRGLHISAADRSYLSPQEHGASLEALPALRALHIHCSKCNAAGSHASKLEALACLVNGVATLTQLSALSLEECFCLNLASHTAGVCLLSRLTQLTVLALQPLVERSATMEPFVRAVKQLTGLRELHVGANMSSRSQCTGGAWFWACARLPS